VVLQGLPPAQLEAQLEVLRLLMNAGACLQAQDKDGDTALQLAVRNGYPEAALLLLGELCAG
jgi:ankyrin repeat protein